MGLIGQKSTWGRRINGKNCIQIQIYTISKSFSTDIKKSPSNLWNPRSKYITSFTHLTNSISLLLPVSVMVKWLLSRHSCLYPSLTNFFQLVLAHTLHYSYKTVVKIGNNIFGIDFILQDIKIISSVMKLHFIFIDYSLYVFM